MKIKTRFRFIGVNPPETWCRLVEQQLNNLQKLIVITGAEILLEHPTGAPSIARVEMVIETSDADLHAETVDSTRQAALLKTTENLERQIRSRQVGRKDKRSAPSMKPERTPGLLTNRDEGGFRLKRFRPAER